MSQSALIKSMLWTLHIFTVRVIARWVRLREEAAVAWFLVAAYHVIAGRGATNSAGRVPNHRSEVTRSRALGWILVVVVLVFMVPGGGAINSVLPSRVCRCEEVFPLAECVELGVVFQTQSISSFAVKLFGIFECIQVEVMVIGERS